MSVSSEGVGASLQFMDRPTSAGHALSGRQSQAAPAMWDVPCCCSCPGAGAVARLWTKNARRTWRCCRDKNDATLC